MALSLKDLRAAGASVHPVYDQFRVDHKKLAAGGNVGKEEAERIMAMWDDQIEAFKRAYGRFDWKVMYRLMPPGAHDMNVNLNSRVGQKLHAFKNAEQLANAGYTSDADEMRKAHAAAGDSDYYSRPSARDMSKPPPKSRAERLAEIQRSRERAAQTPRHIRAQLMSQLDKEERALPPEGGRKKRKTRRSKKTTRTRKVNRRTK
jgi:hypothetical protein